MKDIFNYGYTGEEVMEITSYEFQILKIAIEQAIRNTEEIKFPKKYFWVSTKTDKEIKNPSKKDIESGNVKKMFDRDATFSQNNMVETFDASKLTRDMLEAQEIILQLHARNVEEGIAKSREELEKLNEIKLEKVNA